MICCGCKNACSLHNFLKSERSKPSGAWLCSSCLTKSCGNCHKSKTRACFSSAQWNSVSTELLCQQCDRKRCAVCNKQKGYKEYEQRSWNFPDGDVKLVCVSCCSKGRKRSLWTCQGKQCRKQLPHESFSIAISKYGAHVSGNSRRCNDCIQRQQHLEKDALSESMQYVQTIQRT